MTPTTLITGGAGFISSHLCDRLVAAGENVLCLDNFRTGSKENIRHLFARPNFELLRHDVWLPIYVEVDRIYNLACPASPVHYQQDPVSTTKTAVLDAINMLVLAKRRGARILQASRARCMATRASIHSPKPIRVTSDDPVRRQPDIAKARATLGWEPKVALEDGLAETIRYFCKLLSK